ncbi:hypothetical protein Kisp01_65520 [Kineosporia sp. NBRC 101677]|uniref:hypothetical protein n=1 Tax=Kineosporia sp. NBRC 101677 TaxID=3032197 RepID=UPI0024A2F6A9|nr:hypothetical protein [Kineosporia sp. NBRC 101677]GLY19538.1 hypothetical protein Kisp01_65520 [Kineosporia sp. NBRC 101677]
MLLLSKQKVTALASATVLASLALGTAGASPASAASGCGGYSNSTTGTVYPGGNASPWSYLWSPTPGTYTFCLDGPDGTNLDLVLEQQPDPSGPWVTVASATSPGPDETLTFTDTAFPNTIYHVSVRAVRGSGQYTLGFAFDQN